MLDGHAHLRDPQKVTIRRVRAGASVEIVHRIRGWGIVVPMTKDAALAVLETRTIDDLVIDDEESFRHVALYADLKQVVRATKYAFRILPSSKPARWDRALLLNLTYWGVAGSGTSDGGDVLADEHIAADVVAHVAWHRLAAGALASRSADALFLGEAVASAFDVYLVGRLLGHSPQSSFLETQVPATADAAAAAGLSKREFSALLEGIARDPERAFEDLRALLFDATTSLVGCTGPDDALAALARFDAHRFASLLHRYELSNWVLYARAYAKDALAPDASVRSVDQALRDAAVSLDWLTTHWVTPALTR